MKVGLYLLGVSTGESLSGNTNAGLVFIVLALMAFALSGRSKT